MIKIRLQRTGRRNLPQFRVVVGDVRNGPKSGKFIEILGNYEPKAGGFSVKEDRVKYWLSVGAQVSGTVHNFLVDQGIVDAPKKNVSRLTKKRRAAIEEKKEEAKKAEEEAKAAAEEAASNAAAAKKAEEEAAKAEAEAPQDEVETAEVAEEAPLSEAGKEEAATEEEAPAEEETKEDAKEE